MSFDADDCWEPCDDNLLDDGYDPGDDLYAGTARCDDGCDMEGEQVMEDDGDGEEVDFEPHDIGDSWDGPHMG